MLAIGQPPCCNTKLWTIDVDGKTQDELCALIAEAAALIADNEVVAFPTETVYGLGGNAFSDDAMKKIFAAKGAGLTRRFIIVTFHPLPSCLPSFCRFLVFCHLIVCSLLALLSLSLTHISDVRARVRLQVVRVTIL